jgi:hypothetical protein
MCTHSPARSLLPSVCASLIAVAIVTPAFGAQDPTPTVDDADARFAVQDWAGAAEEYRKIAEARPEDQYAWYQLGLSLQRLGDLDGAIDAYERVQATGNQTPLFNRSIFDLARAHAARGDLEVAIVWLDRLRQLGASAPVAQVVAEAPEFAPLADDERFVRILDAMRPCSDPGYRQFDFWVGDWEVIGPDGQLLGRNRITSVLNGCSLLENWQSVSGVAGISINTYSPANGKWLQTWVDASGTLLLLAGTITDGSMVMTDAAGANRITWTPLEGGNVRQLWEVTRDGGETWTVTFDGVYTPAR